MPENKIKYSSDRHVVKPGGLYFGDSEGEIYTLLGSCVAVTLWHQVRKLVGMCHIMLPTQGDADCHPRFADCAIEHLDELVLYHKTVAQDYEVGVFGGGNMFSSIVNAEKKMIGEKNVDEVEKRLVNAGFHIKFKDVGGTMARKLILHRLSGDVLLEYVEKDR